MAKGVPNNKHGAKKLIWKENENGCWICTSHKTTGIGYIRKGNSTMHRFIYEEMFGEIPKGMVVMHTCDNRKCINPEHLKLGTHHDNNQDMANKGRHGRSNQYVRRTIICSII